MSEPANAPPRPGRRNEVWRERGAHARPGGTDFAVWAPHARAVQVVGDFNRWDGHGHELDRSSDGVWSISVDGVGPGDLYKFAVHGADDEWRLKADPFAFRTQTPPENASVVFDSSYAWGDGDWMSARSGNRPHIEPMSIYEVHLGSWRRGLSYRELAEQLVPYVEATGFTHVELMPVAEHPFGGSWGYQVTGYYAPTARFGDPDDFRALVDAFHQAGIAVLIDWVPAHFPRDAWALARFDGTPLYEDPNPARGEHPDWGTYIFNVGHPDVRDFLVSNALFWLEELHVDGLRVDAVASMLYLDYSREPGEWQPNVHGGRENLEAVAFLQDLNATCYARNPGTSMVAEESTAWPGVTRSTDLGGLGFGFKWNLGWMHDSLGYLHVDPVSRQHHHNQLTFAMMYAYAESFVLPLSHDEVVHGKGSLFRKMPGDDDRRLANLRAYLAFMWAHPGKQLLFMGGEIGQSREWAEDRSLDWDLLAQPGHAGLRSLVCDLNRAYRDHAALWSTDYDPEGFAWIDADDAANNVVSFLRCDDEETVVCVVNFAGIDYPEFCVGVPQPGRWDVLLRTDDATYGGASHDVPEPVQAADEPWHGRAASVVLRLPALSALWLRAARR